MTVLAELWNWFYCNFIHNPVQWLALVLSLINIICYFHDRREKKVKLKIHQKGTSYYFAYSFYEEYDCLFLEVSIENLSSSTVGITSISLTDRCNNTYYPTELDHSTSSFGSIGELCLFDDSERDAIYKFEIGSRNIVKKNKIEAYGSITGFLYFEDVKLSEFNGCDEKLLLTISTPKGKFSNQITSHPLAGNLRPEYTPKS